MKRQAFLLICALVLLGAGLIAGLSLDRARAQDGDEASTANHLLVGSWIVDDPADPADAPSLTVASSSGTIVDFSPTGASAAGSWSATGPESGDATFVYVHKDENGVFQASVVIRASVELTGEDGFDADYSYTAVDADGTVLETRTGVVRGVRIPVEPVDEGGNPLMVMPVVSPAESAPAS